MGAPLYAPPKGQAAGPVDPQALTPEQRGPRESPLSFLLGEDMSSTGDS